MIKDLKTDKLYKEVRNIKQFLEVYPDDDREYKMGFGQKYRSRFVNDIPTDYFDWAVKSWNKDLERNEREKIFKKLSLDDCLDLTKIAEEIARQEEENDNL